MKNPLLILLSLLQICFCYNGSSSFLLPESFSTWKSRNIMYTKDFDWCTLNCQQENHIACVHKGQCKPISPCTVPKFDPAEIVEEHNKLRNKFAKGETTQAPGVTASNMIALDWDWDLAFLATCNLKKCEDSMKHDHCHVTETHKSAGQNLAWTKGFKDPCEKRITNMVNDWFDEIKPLTADQIKALTSNFQMPPMAGHFTQLVWAEITHVGCALTSKDDGTSTICTLACNYGPAGNILTDSMFKEGAAASACSNGLSANAKYPGLCGEGYKATDNPYELNSVSSIYGNSQLALILFSIGNVLIAFVNLIN